jgi:predicted ATPase/DNA-binding SARP family transcriptional activator
MLRVHLLGGFRVLVADQPVPEQAWRSKRAAALVKLLALAPDHRLHREQVIEALWPDLASEAQTNNLNVTVSRARQALEAYGAPPSALVTRDGQMLVLGPSDAVWVDVDAFEAAVAEGWRAQDPAAFQRALALYPGDLLPEDRYEAWAEERRAALQASVLALLSRLGQLHAERGELSYAIAAYQRLVAADLVHEEAHAALMRLYALTGQRSQALAQYEQLVAALRRELDIDPEPATMQLAQAIRTGQMAGSRPPIVSGEPVAAPRSSTTVNNLPAPISTLVGRERELAELRQLLAAGRLLTLTGAGGIGKTRLAIALARAMQETFPDGVAFVDLTPVDDSDLVVPTIAQALDVRQAGTQPIVDTLKAALHDRQLLLVLDNFERVAAAAPFVAELLIYAPGVKALVTSRVRLRLNGEQEYAVPPLVVPAAGERFPGGQLARYAAAALFVQRAREVRSDFVVTSDSAPAVAEICRRLEGLPLAIELAAARAKVLTPPAMLARLDRPLALLTGGARDLPARQQTIRATIEWSYNLLTPVEQRLFRRLAVFVGGWTLEAAEAVADPDPSRYPGQALGIDVLDGLTWLIDSNLVIRRQQHDASATPDVESRPRFGMLETIREFGLERLRESGEELEVRESHAAWFVALAEQAAPHFEQADQVAWYTALSHDDANLRAALEWIRERNDAESGLRLVNALWLYWFVRGWIVEGYAQTAAVIDLPESTAFPVPLIDALIHAGFLAREYGDFDLASAASRRGLALSGTIGDRKRAADALVNLGYVALQQEQYDEARELLQESLATQRALGNQQGVADALSFLGMTAFYHNELEAARRLHEESLATWTALEDWGATVWARLHLAFVLTRQGALAAAYDQLMTCLELSGELDFRTGMALTLDGLAQLAVLQSSFDLALRLVAAAASIREAAGIRLSPREQADAGQLLEQIRAGAGAEATAARLSSRQRWSLDELTAAIRDTLGATYAGAAAITPAQPASPPRVRG